VLPNGMGKTESGDSCLKFSVFVTPRLKPDEETADEETELGEFPDFSSDWPEKVRNMKFEVKFGNGSESTAKAILDKTPLDRELWNALFNNNTFVRLYEFPDYKDRIIRTYPVQGVLSYLKDMYVTIAENSPDSLPLLEPRRDDDGNILDPDASLKKLIDDLGDLLIPEKKVLCTLSRGKYWSFKDALKSGIFDTVLSYIQDCLSKLPPFDGEISKILKIDDNNLKIIKGSEVYYIYIEDTGEEIILYQYIDIYSELDKLLKESKVLDPYDLYEEFPSTVKLDFLQANRFYDRREIERPYYFKPNAKMAPPPPEEHKIDFHQMLAILGDNPLLMRKLGLVLDFHVLVSNVPEEPFSTICLIPNWNNDDLLSDDKKDLTPLTRCIYENGQFCAEINDVDKFKNGMLNLTGANDNLDGGASIYSLIQVDPDGAALKLVNSASSMGRQVKKRFLTSLSGNRIKQFFEDCELNEIELASIFSLAQITISPGAKISKIAANKWIVTDLNKLYELEYTGTKLKIYMKNDKTAYDTPEDAGLPSLRSAGIALVKSGRAYDLSNHFTATFVKNEVFESDTDNQVELFADDLVRGYRVDVLDETTSVSKWLSLCRRKGKYTFPDHDTNSIQVNDEGYVKGASTTSQGGADSDLYLHETVFRWDGWGLCVKRPGKTIVPVSTEKKVYLFNWDQVGENEEEFTKFLVDYLNARWVKDDDTNIIKNTNTITVTKDEKSLELSREGDTVSLIDNDVREYLYDIDVENGNVCTTVVEQEEKIEESNNEAVTEFKLESHFSAVSGSLPSLRFGHTYRLRARIADIAGNSISWESPDNAQASDQLFYARYEPLIPPTIVPRARMSEGEAVERMVIRSNFDKTVQEYVESDDVTDALTNEAYTYEQSNERHIVPPKTSQLTAETHGMFDVYIFEDKDYEKAYYIAKKEKGTLFDTQIVNTETGIEESILNPDDVKIIVPPPKDFLFSWEDVSGDDDELLKDYLKINLGISWVEDGIITKNDNTITITGEENSLIITLNQEEKKVTLVINDAETYEYVLKEEEGKQNIYLPPPGQYVIHQEEQLELPYLPDPIARGAVFRDLPGVTPTGTPELAASKIPFDPDWPDATPFRIRIEELADQSNGSEPPVWDSETRILTVFLAKAQVARVRYSCYLDQDDLDVMGIRKWLSDSSNIDELEEYALSGCHWMLTPFRELELVHAVQQPLFAPTILEIEAIKNQVGDTFAAVEGEFHLSVKSTGKLDLLAYWTEPVDDPADVDGPGTIDVNAHAFELKIDESFNDNLQLPFIPCGKHRHEFGDTKYRHVNYYLQGTTRFREYFHPKVTDYWFCWDDVSATTSEPLINFLMNTLNITWVTEAGIEIINNNKINVKDNDNSLSLELDDSENKVTLKNSIGEVYDYIIKEENGKKNVYAGSKNKISRTDLNYTQEVDVLNSGRPAAPKVLYILPTFGWEENKTPEGADIWINFERSRIGGGLRVYLDRPWYSSGDGELLGVILYPLSYLEENKLKPYITQWGQDPIRDSKIPKGALTTTDFLNKVSSQEGLSLEELADFKMTVVGFKPEYNQERQMWYCDILFDPEEVTSYYPFVRLALARYQPNSIPDAHLSRVVLTDFVQLANDRKLNINFYRDDKKFYISVTGYGTGDPDSNRMEVTIERLPTGGNEEFGWTPIIGTKAQPNPYTMELVSLDTITHLCKWEAELNLPQSRKNKRFRLVVREYEGFKADGAPKKEKTRDNAPPKFETKDEERLVYVDVVEVSPKPEGGGA
jgi:hypothetical protein